MTISKHQQDFSSNYALSDIEYKKLNELLFEKDYTGYAAFLIATLKELDGDISKILRILNTGINGKKKVIPVALYNFLITSIKEAIILSNYKYYIEEDGFISVLDMSRQQRFKMAFIDRQTINRAFKKYKITYTDRRRKS
jgi:hypothetical protein